MSRRPFRYVLDPATKQWVWQWLTPQDDFPETGSSNDVTAESELEDASAVTPQGEAGSFSQDASLYETSTADYQHGRVPNVSRPEALYPSCTTGPTYPRAGDGSQSQHLQSSRSIVHPENSAFCLRDCTAQTKTKKAVHFEVPEDPAQGLSIESEKFPRTAPYPTRSSQHRTQYLSNSLKDQAAYRLELRKKR